MVGHQHSAPLLLLAEAEAALLIHQCEPEEMAVLVEVVVVAQHQQQGELGIRLLLLHHKETTVVKEGLRLIPAAVEAALLRLVETEAEQLPVLVEMELRLPSLVYR